MLVTGLPGLVASDDDEDSGNIDHDTSRADEFPASASEPSAANDHSSAQGLEAQDWAESARLAARNALDELPPLVTSDDESEIDSQGLPHLASQYDDGGDDDDEDPDYESDYESSLSDDDNGMPPLIDFPSLPRITSSVTHLGNSAPLTLDEQDAVDKLSYELDRSEGIVASSRRVSINMLSPPDLISLQLYMCFASACLYVQMLKPAHSPRHQYFY